uniref:Riboflavin synthase n=1 Tax=Pithovirus LCDPAC01 TaxID=2506600 RepID=A0A481YQ32_9VIRU|nr:MAG: lumazine binding domain protein [Pithovirus LCDPAC01]
MFTGIVTALGQIISLNDIKKVVASRAYVVTEVVVRVFYSMRGGKNLKWFAGDKLGASICVNGVCLTVIEVRKNGLDCSFHVMNETKKICKFFKGQYVNLEKAVGVGTDLSGDIMLGHIAHTSKITLIRSDGSALILRILVKNEFMNKLTYKGTVFIDGMSLTVSALNKKEKYLEVSLLPHTIENTTSTYVEVGQQVNLDFRCSTTESNNLPGKRK